MPITARGDKNTNYARTQCVFQGASSIASASVQTEEEKERKKTRKHARATVGSATGVYAFDRAGVYVGCVGRGGSASAGA